jgi:hypothetical protein
LTIICNYPPNIDFIILQTLKFKALLLVRSFASSSSSIARQPQELVISSDPSIPMVDLSADDVIFNPITSESQLASLVMVSLGEGQRRSLSNSCSFLLLA